MITNVKQILAVNKTGIPDFLKVKPFWANWKAGFFDGKARKLPTHGSTVLRGQYWDDEGSPFEDAFPMIPNNGGLIFLLSTQHDLACIDIDNCKINSPRLEKILNLVPGTWYEYSPSGNGIHVWGVLPDKTSYLLPGRKTIGYCGKDYEWYATGRGITVTGHHVYGNSFVDLTPAVQYIESLRPKIIKQKHVVNSITITMSVDSILEKAFDREPELYRMYCFGHSWSDKSAEDFHFCQRMWFWLGGHGVSAIESVFESSALYRQDKGPHYVSTTVRNAGKRWNGTYYGKKF